MIKKSLILFIILSVAASAMNYIAYPLFSRILTSEEYVNITVSLSLFTQVSAFLSSILAITIGLSKSEHTNHANEKIELLQAFLFKLFFLLAICFLAVSPFVMSSVNTPVLFAIPIALMMLLSIPVSIISGYFTGKNQMIKLGFVAVISAGSQFTIGVLTALITQNGLITMLSMSIAQIISLILIYSFFSKDNLPRITTSIKIPLRLKEDPKTGKLILYAAISSLAIMAISLMQIIDLFIFQSLKNVDIKFYADIYVVSRIVFFVGMIFIWPFLGEISVDHHHVNRKPFAKVIGYFAIISLTAMAALYFFGDILTHLLFGANYSLLLVSEVGILSVLFKFLMLIVTAVVLYFVVLRSYVAVWLSATMSGLLFAFTEFIDKESDMTMVLIGLNTIAGVFAVLGIVLLLQKPIRKVR